MVLMWTSPTFYAEIIDRVVINNSWRTFTIHSLQMSVPHRTPLPPSKPVRRGRIKCKTAKFWTSPFITPSLWEFRILWIWQVRRAFGKSDEPSPSSQFRGKDPPYPPSFPENHFFCPPSGIFLIINKTYQHLRNIHSSVGSLQTRHAFSFEIIAKNGSVFRP